MTEKTNLGAEFSVAHRTGQRGCRALRGRHSFFLGLALLPLQHGTGSSTVLTENCTLLDLSSPSWSVLCQVFPVVQVDLKTLQGGFQSVLVAFFGATLSSFATFQFTKEDLFWQSCTGHSGHMAGPSQLCLSKQGGDAGQIGLAEDFSVRNSVLPFDLQQFS